MLQLSRTLCRALALGAAMIVTVSSGVVTANGGHEAGRHHVRHVLLISVDGLHAVDLARFVRMRPDSALGKLAHRGVTYGAASSAKPSDSFPGLLAMTTGGGPTSTGVWYDDSYDRTLSAPGSDCSVVGTEVVYDESIDRDVTRLDAGGGIDPAALPRDPAHGCSPVYPHQFLRVNTIFNVVREAGGRTAWSDKHPSYDILNGHSGGGVMDLYSPEIASNVPGTDGSNPDIWTSQTFETQTYDDIKVQAVLNQIDGYDHAREHHVGVPTLFGMNFQAVSVGEKSATGGYADPFGTPSPELQGAIEHTDASLGRLVAELRRRDLFDSTLVIITAKHGQSPIDRSKRAIVSSNAIPSAVNSVSPDLVAQATQDDIALLWLSDQSQTIAAAAKLASMEGSLGLQEILAGDSLMTTFNDPANDPRIPDIIGLPNQGVIYTKVTATKIAEHGGFAPDDTNVALLVAGPRVRPGSIKSAVETTQIAPTILAALGLSPSALDAVRMEHTAVLPGLSGAGD